MINKPYSESCEQNKDVILSVFKSYLEQSKTVLEIASGTGQHAVYFSSIFKQLIWQTSDLEQHHSGIQSWIDDSGLDNVLSPLNLDVCKTWPKQQYDLMFSANSLHIMSSKQVECFIKSCTSCLNADGYLLIYGPFNYQQQYSSDSNRRFDGWLKQQNPLSGIKDFDWLNALALNAGLQFVQDVEMPANNRILIWQKKPNF